jgi:hypothetical protein
VTVDTAERPSSTEAITTRFSLAKKSRGETVGETEPVQGRERPLTPLEARPPLLLVRERNGPSGTRVVDAGLDPRPGSRDAIEQRDYLTRIGVGLVDRLARSDAVLSHEDKKQERPR